MENRRQKTSDVSKKMKSTRSVRNLLVKMKINY